MIRPFSNEFTFDKGEMKTADLRTARMPSLWRDALKTYVGGFMKDFHGRVQVIVGEDPRDAQKLSAAGKQGVGIEAPEPSPETEPALSLKIGFEKGKVQAADRTDNTAALEKFVHSLTIRLIDEFSGRVQLVLREGNAEEGGPRAVEGVTQFPRIGQRVVTNRGSGPIVGVEGEYVYFDPEEQRQGPHSRVSQYVLQSSIEEPGRTITWAPQSAYHQGEVETLGFANF